ncbi:hypothetical protein MFLAVUS_006595 [Mucor flavus]|uniref:Uncharacterized protein n=1 Tax=Mucor flavus TaxID=439312 RepID=A0ABP9Z1Z5_9FUNG
MTFEKDFISVGQEIGTSNDAEKAIKKKTVSVSLPDSTLGQYKNWRTVLAEQKSLEENLKLRKIPPLGDDTVSAYLARNSVFYLANVIINANMSDEDYIALKGLLSPVAELEQSYRDIIIFPLLKTCINMVNNDRLLFISGEVPLGTLLFCLATIAQSYKCVSLETLSSLELYFAQTKGQSIQLRYLKHLRDNTYAIVRESKVTFLDEKDTVLTCPQFTGLLKESNFCWKKIIRFIIGQ